MHKKIMAIRKWIVKLVGGRNHKQKNNMKTIITWKHREYLKKMEFLQSWVSGYFQYE
jgi:hypothetical protein